MRATSANAVETALSDDEVAHLNKLSTSRSVSVRLAERLRIILLAGTGMTNEEIGDEPGITRQDAGECATPKVASMFSAADTSRSLSSSNGNQASTSTWSSARLNGFNCSFRSSFGSSATRGDCLCRQRHRQHLQNQRRA